LTDFLVIGGGIAGLSAGARLSLLGQVTLLETETALGYHTSGRSAALYEETYGLPSTVALNRASKSFFLNDNPHLVTERGLLLVAGPDDAAAFAHDLATMEMTRLTLPEAQAILPILNPDVVTQAAFHAAAWDIDTDALLQSHARTIRANGGKVLTGQQVTAIRRRASGWTVTTPAGDIDAAHIVNAAGAWADSIAAMAGLPPLGITPLRRSIARIPAPDGHDTRSWPMTFGAGESWYMKPDAGALIVSPADEDPSHPHDAWPDDMVLAEGLARYESHVTTPVTRLIGSWAGLRSFAPDRQLVLGPDPLAPTFLWSAGQGGYGFQTSPAASQLVADLAAGRAPALDAATVAALSPARFRQK
jgi:glycine/D-amino acid oxidase-like deaminating enzyme